MFIPEDSNLIVLEQWRATGVPREIFFEEKSMNFASRLRYTVLEFKLNVLIF